MAVPGSASQEDTHPSRPHKTLAEPGWDEALPSSLGRKSINEALAGTSLPL